jgi:hypothetical protein
VLQGPTVTVVATVAAWLALEAVSAVHAMGVAVPLDIAIACAVVAGPLAITAGVRSVLAVWRGPPVIAFAGEAVRCGPADAEAVRSSAQLKGTMGGAGHVYRARLVLPIAAWAGAILAGAEVAAPSALQRAGPWPLLVAAVAAFGAWLFPSRPYWYRETTGGGVVVTPPEAAAFLTARGPGDGRDERAAEPGQSA